MTDDVVRFRPGDLAEKLAARGEPAGRIGKRDLERYYHALAETLKTVDLTEAEACLICDSCNGVLHEPWSMTLLWAGVADSIRLDGLDCKWHVDGPALVEKLRGLSYCQSLAVVDAVERFWLAPNEPEQIYTVGLVKRQKAQEEE